MIVLFPFFLPEVHRCAFFAQTAEYYLIFFENVNGESENLI